jgi:phosphate transport system substrate-binding protein
MIMASLKLRFRAFPIIIFLILLVLQNGCYFKSSRQSVIRIKGSDTMLNLTTMLANEFMKTNSGISVYVDGGGTKTGIEALVNGSIDVCTASRLLKPEEIKIMANQYGSIGVSTLVAKDALSIYLHPANPVKNLSLDDVKNIFTCKIINWKTVGGDNHPIRLITRSPNSGTYLYFKEHVLQTEDYCVRSEVIATTAEIVDIIAQDNYAIGYGGIGYGEKVNHLPINNIEPSAENVRNETYPISRYLFFVTRNAPEGVTKIFIDWVLSKYGQQLVKKVGFIPLWD